MPLTCIVVDCGSRADRDKVSFFRIPTVQTSVHYPEIYALSSKRREKWIAAIKREDLTESILKNQRMCSKHFITGKPSALKDENHPDWVPSQHMGHTSQAHLKRKSDVDRKNRAEKRSKTSFDQRLEEDEDTVRKTEENLVESEFEVIPGCSTQTDLTMRALATKEDQLKFASNKITQLEKKVENSPLGLMEDINNESMWKYYSGFDYQFVITVIFPEVESYVTSTSTTALTPLNQLLLTLVKLRLNLHFKDLAFRFKISPTTATTYFQNMIEILYRRFKSLIIWPERDDAKANIPSCFKEAFQEKTTIIIDCFEVFIEKPDNYLTQQQCWSNYKHHHTIKFLIGITPQGTISYISKGWGGRTSDKQMVELGDFLNLIKPGDVVLADRGFLIGDSLGVLQAKLVIPAFTKGKTQLHPLEVEATRHIAHVRIHVERIIGVIKNKFRIFKGPLPISMLKVGNEQICLLDKIVTVCSGLINIIPPIVPG